MAFASGGWGTSGQVGDVDFLFRLVFRCHSASAAAPVTMSFRLRCWFDHDVVPLPLHSPAPGKDLGFQARISLLMAPGLTDRL